MKTFPCGCTFETNAEGKIIFDPSINHLPKDCSATWDLICDGNVKGVFQLEKQKDNAIKVQPRNIEELSDLIAIIRPGCTEAIVKGKSLTNHYIDRKHRRDTIEYLHPALEPILASTQGILVYQEQAMQIAKDLAGFSLQEADILRKAIGKKNVSLMAKIKEEFIKKAEEHGILNKEEAVEIFSWIEKSQRYSFNKSHSVSYAYNGYLTAYAKAHFPHEFITAYLKNAIGKPDMYYEISQLVNNARIMDIEVMPPTVRHMNKNFELIGERPTFGLTDIKKVGGSVFEKMIECMNDAKLDIENCNWYDFLIVFGDCIKKDSFLALILAGALDIFRVHRSVMQHEFNMFKELKKREIPWIQKYKAENPMVTLVDCLNAMMIENDWSDKKRPIFREARCEDIQSIIDTLENPPYNLIDNPEWIAKNEQEYLGISLTCSKVDEYDTSPANCTCKEFHNGFQSVNGISIAAELIALREYTIKRGNSKGKKMAFMAINDGTYCLDNTVLFSDEYDKHKQILNPKCVYLFRGIKDKKNGSLIIKNIKQLQ